MRGSSKRSREDAPVPTRPPRGTRDFYPEELRRREWLFAHFRDVSRRFGFEEVDAPLVEHAELFIRKAGEEIVEQLYHFTLHDRHLALRPEITPQVARMVMARAGAARFPLRWFSIPQCWRYERTTRGRRREHYQWNMDVFGAGPPEPEAELIAAVFALLDALGLEPGDVKVRVSSRKLLEELLCRLGVLERRPEVFEPICVQIDKLEKIGGDAVVEGLSDPAGPVRLERSTAELIVFLLRLRVLDDLRSRDALGPDSQAVAELEGLFERLDDYGVRDRVVFDASIVRGLAYYTGIVFEAFDAAGRLRALCGGGRYDRLLQTLGGPAIPAAGFGFGDAVITELLAERKLLPERPRGLDAVVVAIRGAGAGREEERAAVRLATRLRGEGRSVELVLGEARLRRVLANADRASAARVYLVGSEERARGCARVRDLRTGEERDEPLERRERGRW